MALVTVKIIVMGIPNTITISIVFGCYDYSCGYIYDYDYSYNYGYNHNYIQERVKK